jgi:hypothetical protein
LGGIGAAETALFHVGKLRHDAARLSGFCRGTVMRVKQVVAILIASAALGWLVWPQPRLALDRACRPADAVATVSAALTGRLFWQAQDQAVAAALAPLATGPAGPGPARQGAELWRQRRLRWLTTCRAAIGRHLGR